MTTERAKEQSKGHGNLAKEGESASFLDNVASLDLLMVHCHPPLRSHLTEVVRNLSGFKADGRQRPAFHSDVRQNQPEHHNYKRFALLDVEDLHPEEQFWSGSRSPRLKPLSWI